MNRTIVSGLLAAAPFAFGAFRYLQTGSDQRMLWMAVAAHIGAGAVMLGGGRRSGFAIAAERRRGRVASRVRLWTLRHRELGSQACSMICDAFRI